MSLLQLLFLFIIVILIGVAVGLVAGKWRYSMRIKDDTKLSKSTPPTTDTVYVSKGELRLSLRALKNELETLSANVHQIELRCSEVFIENLVRNILAKNLPDSMDGYFDEKVKNESQKALIRFDEVSKDELLVEVERMAGKILTDNISLLSKEIEKLPQNLTFKEIVKEQVDNYLREKLLDLNKEVESYVVNCCQQFVENNRHQEPVALIPSESSLPEIPDALESSANDIIAKIKTALLEIGIVDESELALINTTTDCCTFVINLMAHGINLNQPVTNYQQVDKVIRELTDGNIALIIPNIGEDITPAEHKVVVQQTVTKGKLNAIVTLIRPGVSCNNVIRCKAEVVQSI
jgi:hypothetical protein